MNIYTYCCLVGDQSCGTEWRDPRSSNCYNPLKIFCQKEDRMFKLGACQAWCANNPEECTSYMSSICNNPANFNNGYCKTWCMQNMGLCDTAINDWCSKYNDPICKCIQSPLSRHQYNPLCQDGDCIRDGYATSSMLTSRGGGCQIVDCSTYFDISAGGQVNFEDTSISQRCGTPPPAVAAATTETSSSGLSRKYLLYIGLGIAVLFIGFLVYRFKRK